MNRRRDPSLQQILAGMPSRFCPEAANGLSAVLQFRLTGEQETDFYATIADDTCVLAHGVHNNPTLTLKMPAETYIDMVMGRITGQEAFFRRRLRFDGPISLAVRIHRFFRPPETINRALPTEE